MAARGHEWHQAEELHARGRAAVVTAHSSHPQAGSKLGTQRGQHVKVRPQAVANMRREGPSRGQHVNKEPPGRPCVQPFPTSSMGSCSIRSLHWKQRWMEVNQSVVCKEGNEYRCCGNCEALGCMACNCRNEQLC